MKELADTKEKLKKVILIDFPGSLKLNYNLSQLDNKLIHTLTHTQLSDLDEVAMGSEGRQELEGKIEDLEDKVEECEKMQRDVFIVICQRLIAVMSEHLAQCDQEGVDYETTWFLYNLDYLRQLLIQVSVAIYSSIITMQLAGVPPTYEIL